MEPIPTSHDGPAFDACQALVDARIISGKSLGAAFSSAASPPSLYQGHLISLNNPSTKDHIAAALSSLFAVNIPAHLASHGESRLVPTCSAAFTKGCISASSERIGKDYLTVRHTRVSSLFRAVLGLGLYVLNIAIKVVRFVIHFFQFFWYGAKAIFGNDLDKKTFCFTAGLLLGEFCGLLLIDHLRAIYLVFKNLSGFIITPSIADYREKQGSFLNRVFTIVPKNAITLPPPNSDEQAPPKPRLLLRGDASPPLLPHQL